ncbi:MAG: SLC13 family permease [Candidatus Eisenbacteria bacterium]|uniref:SLC13 family permease n=1 Tax=Eiseniibacteriota bacterium TaxID=2212470 RepID=A0A948RWM6_UNCEI|nr:SLC13 family permease [Candidatus Eisenbacteria bacterium]MBU1950989.1 SLC13 family permease [Candidatus Eisenbacteria bacterium]MBU2690902.1 SLC13 family permease [Candidatus Eisenbacteria bacterium]
MKRKSLILGLIIAAIPIVIPGGAITPEQRKMAAVAILMAVWWITEAIPIPATALLPLALFPLLGIMPSKQVAPSYGDQLVFLFLGGFLIASAIERWNLHRRIAILTISWIGASPGRLLIGFMTSTALLSMWISNTATALMMVPIAIAVVTHLADASPEGHNRESLKRELGCIIMLGIAYAASIGGVGTLIGTPPNIVFTGLTNKLFPEAPEISFMQWMIIGVPFVLVAMPAAAWVIWRFGGTLPKGQLHPGEAARQVREERRKLGPMTGAEKVVLTVFATTALLWMTRRPIELGSLTLPGWSTLFPWQAGIHDATVAVTMALLLFILPVRPPGSKSRRPVLQWQEAVGRVPWGILILFGGGFALAAGFRQTGLDGWLGAQLAQLTGVATPFLVLATSLLTTFLTEVTSNTATTTLLMPVLASAAKGAHLHPYLLMLPAALAASCAFMLPVATPPNAIVFGSGWLTIPRMARTGLILNLITALIIVALVLTLGRLALDMGSLGLPAWASTPPPAP